MEDDLVVDHLEEASIERYLAEHKQATRGRSARGDAGGRQPDAARAGPRQALAHAYLRLIGGSSYSTNQTCVLCGRLTPSSACASCMQPLTLSVISDVSAARPPIATADVKPRPGRG